MELIVTIRKTVADKAEAYNIVAAIKGAKAEGEIINAQLIDKVE